MILKVAWRIKNMLASEVIEKLQKLIEEYGDLEVKYVNLDSDYDDEILDIVKETSMYKNQGYFKCY